MTADEWDDEPERDDDDDYYDDDDYREPDGEDGDIARSYEEYWEHRDKVHGGGECDCRPSLRDRLADVGRRIINRLWALRWWLTSAARQPCTLRLGPAEITVRFRPDRKCGACAGQGWFYTLNRSRPDDRPPGYNGAALCGCGSAISQLAGTRRRERQARTEPLF